MRKKITSKLVIVLFFCSFSSILLAQNSLQTDKVSISRKNTSIKELFKAIEEQSEYTFFYNDDIFDANKKIDIDYKNETIANILKNILKEYNYSIDNKKIIITAKPPISNTVKNIKGKIQITDGTAMPGVSIIIKGTTRGTISDANGNYSLDVKEGEVIEFSFLGYKTDNVIVNKQSSIDITLVEDALSIDEVVVTALGIKRETKTLTYNVQELKTLDAVGVPDANLMTGLAGKVAGVQINSSAGGIGGASRVVMRGAKSLFGNNNALYVIDGIPMPSYEIEQSSNLYESVDGGDKDAISDINPDDIESMSILTGAAAAALYGGQGANGVVLINTKKGKTEKLSLSYSNTTSFLSPFIMPKFQNTYGSEEGSFYSWGPKLASPTSYDPKDFFQTGYNEINSIGVSTGNEKNQTYISVSSLNARGIIPNNKFDRLNFTIRNTTQLVENKLTLDLSASYINQYDKNMLIQGQYHNPLIPIYLFPRGDDIEKYKVYERYNPDRNFKTQFWPYGEQSFGMQNPYWIVNKELFENKKQRYMLGAMLKYDVSSWLSLSGRTRMDNYSNTYTRKLPASTSTLFASEMGNYKKDETENKYLYADVMATMDKDFGKFGVLVNFGASIVDQVVDVSIAEGHLKGFANLFTLENIDRTHAQTKFSEQPSFHDQNQSVFGTAQLSYKNYLFLDVTGRNEWPSQLSGSNTESFFYPSVGLSGIFTDMFKLPRVITFLKGRVSYSEVGNPPPRFATNPTIPIYDGELSDEKYARFKDLKPERTKSFETGINLRLFKNKLQLDVTYYNSNTYNQLFVTTVSSASRYKYFRTNGGKVNNYGIEALLGYKQDIYGLQWETNFTFGFNKNEIKELLPEYIIAPDGKLTKSPDEINMSTAGTYMMKLRQGGSLSDIYVSTLKTDEHGYIKADPQTGAISADPETWLKAGSNAPKWNLGWRNNFTYKNIDFSFLIDVRYGGVGVSATQALMDRFGVSEESARYRDEGGVPLNGGKVNPEAYYSVAAGGTTGVLSQYVYDLTNVRLREVMLTYHFNPNWFKGVVKGLSVSLTGRNLIMFYNRAPFDPELTANSGTYFQGFDYFMPPSLRNMGFSINVKF